VRGLLPFGLAAAVTGAPAEAAKCSHGRLTDVVTHVRDADTIKVGDCERFCGDGYPAAEQQAAAAGTAIRAMYPLRVGEVHAAAPRDRSCVAAGSGSPRSRLNVTSVLPVAFQAGKGVEGQQGLVRGLPDAARELADAVVKSRVRSPFRTRAWWRSRLCRHGRRSMAGGVRADEWVLADEMPESRRLALSNPLPAGDLIAKVVCAARQAADKDEFFVCWEASTKQPGQARVSSVFRCPEEAFDQFFNGRTGYRAQYYLAPELGEACNREVLDRLEPVVRCACLKTITPLVPEVADRESLSAPGAKVWFRERREHYLGDRLIRPARWVAYWEARPDEFPMGLIPAPRDFPWVQVKGGWVYGSDGYPAAGTMKPDRAISLHNSGWT